jgi:hypothetical protein
MRSQKDLRISGSITRSPSTSPRHDRAAPTDRCAVCIHTYTIAAAAAIVAAAAAA